MAVTESRTNGRAAQPGVLDLPAAIGGGRRVRRPELAVGVVLIVGCALAATLLFLQSDRKVPVAAFAADVAAGDVIKRSDLEVVYISHDGSIATVSPEGAATFVGKPAARDVGRGSLLTADVVAEAAPLAAGEGVVGLSVSRSTAPSSRLTAGDLVNVVFIEDGSTRVVERAVVHEVEELEDGSGWTVSVRTSLAIASRIAAVDPQTVRLVLVGE